MSDAADKLWETFIQGDDEPADESGMGSFELDISCEFIPHSMDEDEEMSEMVVDLDKIPDCVVNLSLLLNYIQHIWIQLYTTEPKTTEDKDRFEAVSIDMLWLSRITSQLLIAHRIQSVADPKGKTDQIAITMPHEVALRVGKMIVEREKMFSNRALDFGDSVIFYNGDNGTFLGKLSPGRKVHKTKAKH